MYALGLIAGAATLAGCREQRPARESGDMGMLLDRLDAALARPAANAPNTVDTIDSSENSENSVSPDSSESPDSVAIHAASRAACIKQLTLDYAAGKVNRDCLHAAAAHSRWLIARSEAAATSDSTAAAADTADTAAADTAAADSAAAARRLYAATVDLADGRASLAIATLRDLLAATSPADAAYTEPATLLAIACRTAGRAADEARRVAQIAVADCEAGRSSAFALCWLARWASDNGQPGRAYAYLHAAEARAAAAGEWGMAAVAAQLAPSIGSGYRADADAATRRAYAALAVAAALLLLAATAICRLWRRGKALAADRQALATANDAKEKCLGRFLALCHSCMEKLDEATKIVTRKLAAGQYEDLYHLARAGKLAEDQRQMLYKEFDSTFTRLFPTFVSEVNALMRPGEALAPAPAGRLSPELRILAFMRLGIDDGAMTARFLGVSVNTVYAYRTRMKSRAADRDGFEAAVMAIGRK